MPFFSRRKTSDDFPSTFPSASGLASSQVTTQQLQLPTNSQSQSHLQSSQEEQLPVCTWSAHAPPFGQSLSPFLRMNHTLSTSASPAGELFLFGGLILKARSRSNDLYVISTRGFSTTLLKTSGDVPNPRNGHRSVLTGTTLLISGGMTGSSLSDQNPQNQSNEDSSYLLNLGMSYFLISRPASADRSLLRFRISRVDPHRDQWSRAWPSFFPYHDVGRFQGLRLRWLARQEVF